LDRDEGRSDEPASRGARLAAFLRARGPAVRALGRRLRPAAKLLLLLVGAWVCVGVLTVSVIEVGCRRGGGGGGGELARPRPPVDLPDYARPQADTYLSYPEWYIVWSYQEKAVYQATHLPSGFPYFGAIGQYWSAYCAMNRQVQGRYPFDVGDHLMLVVIGTSFTVEYALKAAYENTIGRVSEWLSSHQAVEEDGYARTVAQQYADFVLVRPFYEFSFLQRFAGLWRETHVWGPHPLRKWERKLFLSLDYGVEAFYCELIELATRLTFGVAGTDTYASIAHAADSAFTANPHVRRVRALGPDSFLVIIPRYQEFTPTALSLAQHGVRFTDVAGNATIVVSLLAPRSFTWDPHEGTILFSMDLLTDPQRQRLVVQAPVASLHALLVAWRRRGLEVEHIYDY